jgi:hypothetical protein
VHKHLHVVCDHLGLGKQDAEPNARLLKATAIAKPHQTMTGRNNNRSFLPRNTTPHNFCGTIRTKIKKLLAWAGTNCLPPTVTGSNGEPDAKIAAPL